MAITQAMCSSFKQELLEAKHNFIAGQHAFNIALFTSSASLSATTTAYSSTNEVANGNGYATGGVALTEVNPTLDGTTAIADFSNDPTWTSATFTARGAVVYNTSASNRAVIVLNFSTDRTATNGTFKITFPTADASDAIIRIA